MKFINVIGVELKKIFESRYFKGFICKKNSCLGFLSFRRSLRSYNYLIIIVTLGSEILHQYTSEWCGGLSTNSLV